MATEPTFTRHADGRVTVDEWPPSIDVAVELLADARAEFLVSDGHDITITVSNGRATYRICEWAGPHREGDIVCPGRPLEYQGFVRAHRKSWKVDAA